MTLDVHKNEKASIPIVTIAELERSPHETFRRYRDKVAVVRREDGPYLALRAVEMDRLYDEANTRQLETEYLRMRGIKSGPIFDWFQNTMLCSNGTFHKRRRAPFIRSFAFRAVEELRPRIRGIVAQVLDEHSASGRMDLLDDFASIIPATAIASIIGLDPGEIPRFTKLVYDFSRIVSASWTEADLPAIEEAAVGLTEYVEAIIRRSRRYPQPGFMQDYLNSVDAAGTMSHVEAVMQLFTVILAGSDTTRSAIVIQTSLLLSNRHHWRTLVAARGLLTDAVLEALRFEPAVATVPRVAVQDIPIDGFVIPKNNVLLLSTMSAMRDPDVYPNADLFDIERGKPKWHPVFGGGVHRCVGEALAKVELEEALLALLERFPNLRALSDYPRIEGHAGIRRVGHFDVTWA